MANFFYYKQLNAMDCGPTCLRMIARYYGKHLSAEKLREMTGLNKSGVSLLSLSDAAEKLGMRTRAVKIGITQLKEISLPIILHWEQYHYVVLISINNKVAKVADPALGIVRYSIADFKDKWISSVNTDKKEVGIALMIEPSPTFYTLENHKESKLSWNLIINYLRKTKWQLFQVFVAMFVASIFSLIFPFLTQSVVDTGINTQNISYVILVLIAQIMLTFSQTIVGFIRSRLLLKISNILNIQILSDFWIKLTRLPLSYFDVHKTGDILQRIGDHRTIQNFLTGTAINTFFSFFNFFVYAIVLIIYSINIFIVFCIGNVIYFLWVALFLRIRRKLNYETFDLSAKEKNTTLQLIQGMQEIRLHNAEKIKRWEWENIQAHLFKLGFKGLNYGQIQSAGATLINQTQGLLISFTVAQLVIQNQLTLGAMLAVQYVVGQLSDPINQWVGFIQSSQDAKISMERLNDIHQMNEEEDVKKTYITELPEKKNIVIKSLSFKYPGVENENVLNNINLIIYEKKVTAIVGASGSGKTTLLKILLKIYQDYQGEIRIGGNIEVDKSGQSLRNISSKFWRSSFGAVLQDGYIFNDSIAKNIAVGDENINQTRLTHACQVANIYDFIESLPNGYYTLLGAEGVGLSQGQKQRILIARAIYKNPEYIFFDEATNSLDTKNEKEIVQNLDNFFTGKTVVIIAHRLSTVKNADKIVVLDNGSIVEEGTHEELSNLKGKYYELIKNQLELG